MTDPTTSMKDDLYASVTGRIVAALERGAPPWVRPWSQDVDSVPVNAAGRRPYRGINALLLTLEANSQGYALNRWLTYRQASELGAPLRGRPAMSTLLLTADELVAITGYRRPRDQIAWITEHYAITAYVNAANEAVVDRALFSNPLRPPPERAERDRRIIAAR